MGDIHSARTMAGLQEYRRLQREREMSKTDEPVSDALERVTQARVNVREMLRFMDETFPEAEDERKPYNTTDFKQYGKERG